MATTTKTTKTNSKPFAKMTEEENADFNLGKDHAWEESPKIPNGSEKYIAGYAYAAGIVNRIRTVLILFAEGCTEAELEGREAGMLEDRGGCTYQADSQEYRDWFRGFNVIFKARIQHKQVLDNALEKDDRRDRILRWRMEERKVLGATSTRLPYAWHMTEEQEAKHCERLSGF
jgi:hypothetical protein